MSISSIQKEKVFSHILRRHFQSGTRPIFTDIMREVSKYFHDNTLGNPIPIDPTYLGDGSKSSPTRYNSQMKNTIQNLSTLYEASFDQVQEIMMLSTLLRSEVDRLDVRRKRLVGKIDDYLFSLYNTDGYYYSISDNFADLLLTDVSMTSAVLDTEIGGVTIPAGSSGTKIIDQSQIANAAIQCTLTSDSTNAPIPQDTVSDFSSAIDGFSNTAWILQVDRLQVEPVTCTLTVSFLADLPAMVSKIDFNPYGVTPVQLFVKTKDGQNDFEQFGNSIKSGTDHLLFIDQARTIAQAQFTIIKRTPDYTITKNNQALYRYIFGAKEIAFSECVYDSEAVLVSDPLSIDSSLVDDHVIDAVSLTSDVDVPIDSRINFYVAADNGISSPTIDDFDWKSINPVGSQTQTSNVIVQFNGAATYRKNIVEDPSSSELQMIVLNDDDPDPQKRNPSQVIIDGSDIYRIASFGDDTPLIGSILLEEGVNTTKIHYVDHDSDALELAFWKDYLNDTLSASIVYGHIDTGNDFFYGGEIEADKSVYVETYLESLEDQPLVVKPFRKSDPNSKQWAVKVFLNGTQLAYLPVGTDEFLIPWHFVKGLNYISLIVDVPSNSEEFPSVNIGTLDLMGESNLYDFGTVKLANWTYVDFFNMQHNQVGQPRTFTIYNSEIITRRKPTTSFRIKYGKATNAAPSAVRVRADFQRDDANPNVTPILKSYRLRFLYGAT